MDLAGAHWSEAMHALFKVPTGLVGRIVPTSGNLARAHVGGRTIPITAMIGDQQAATVGQGCLAPGMAKCTYGTGIFLLANAGGSPPQSRNRLLATHLTSTPLAYAMEGSIFVGGDAVKWLRDGLGILESAAETEAIARSVPDSGGVLFVPAFAGLGAPHWQPDARGLLTGLTGGTTRAHIVRATLEAMGQQTADLVDAFAADGVGLDRLRIDGGMAVNAWLAQDIADALGIPVERPETVETTALGAAILAAVGAGLFADPDAAVAAMVRPRDRFEPLISPDQRAARRAAWTRAVAQTLAGLQEAPR
jgi:glycerol kinase